MPISDWLSTPEGGFGQQENTSGGLSGIGAFMGQEQWEDYGIFEKSSLTGELRLKKKDNMLGGLSRDILGHYESDRDGISLFNPSDKFKEVDQELILDNNELDSMNREPELDSVFDWAKYSYEQAGSGFFSAFYTPYLGLNSATRDIQSSIMSSIGADETAAKFKEDAGYWKDKSDEAKMGLNQLTPVMESGHPISEMGGEALDVIKSPLDSSKWKELAKDLISFNGSVMTPMAVHAGLALATAGASVPLTTWQYGLQSFDDIYSAVRYDENGQENNSAFAALGAAVPGAVISGALETVGFKGLFEHTGKRWIVDGLKAGGKEFATEALQTGEQDLITKLPDVYSDYIAGPKSIDIDSVGDWGWNELGKMGLDGAAGFLSGSAIHAAGSVKRAVFGSDESQASGSINASQLDDTQYEKLSREMGEFKVLVDMAGGRSSNWTPEHQQAFNNIESRWGKVVEVRSALDQIAERINDPVASGAREGLKESTEGGQDAELIVESSLDSLWVSAVNAPTESERANSLGTFVEEKRVFGSADAAGIASVLRGIDVSKLSPTETSLLSDTVKLAVNGIDTEVGRAEVLAARDGLRDAAIKARAAGDVAASQIFGQIAKSIPPINDDSVVSPQDIGSIAGSVINAANQLKQAHGKLIGKEGQKSIVAIQSALFDRMEKMYKEDRIGSPHYKASVDAIQRLNVFLDKENIALSDKKYIEPALVWTALNEEVEPALNGSYQSHRIADSVLNAVANAANTDTTLGLSPAQLLTAARGAMSQISANDLEPGIKDEINSVLTSVSDRLRDKTLDRAHYSQEIKEVIEPLQKRLRDSEESAQRTKVASVLSKYQKAAMEEAAKGWEGGPLADAILWQDESVIELKKNNQKTKIAAENAVTRQVVDAMKVVHARNTMVRDNNDFASFYSYMNTLTEDLGARRGDPEKAIGTKIPRSEIEGAQDVLATMIGHIVRVRDAQGLQEEIVRDVNKLLVKIGTAKSAERSSGIWDKTNKRWRVPDSRLIDFAKLAMGMREGKLPAAPRPGAGGPQQESRTFIEAKEDVRNEFSKATKLYQSGKAEWNDELAGVLFNLVKPSEMPEIVRYIRNRLETDEFLKNAPEDVKKDEKGPDFLFSHAVKLASSMPRGNTISAETMENLIASEGERGFGYDVNNVQQEAWKIAAPILDSERVGIMMNRLYNLRSEKYPSHGPLTATGQDSSMNVIKNLLGIGEYKRSDYTRAAKDLSFIYPELQDDARQSVANPSTDMREPISPANVDEFGNYSDYNTSQRDSNIDPEDTETWDEVDGVIEDGRFRKIHEDEDTEGLELTTDWGRISGSRGNEARRPALNRDVVNTNRQILSNKNSETNIGRALKEWDRVRDIRTKSLVEFYDVMTRAGYNIPINKELYAAIDRVKTTGVYDSDAKAALKYIEKFYRAASASVKQGSSPTAIGFQLLNQGYSAEESTLAVSLIDSLAGTWAKRTGNQKLDFYQTAARLVTGSKANTGMAAARRKNTQTVSYGAAIGFPAFQKLKKAFIGIFDKLITPSGRRDIFTPAHEFIHALIESGQMSNFFTDEQRIRIEQWVGGRLPRMNPKTGLVSGELDSAAQEKLIAGILITNITSNLNYGNTMASYPKQAMLEIRDTMFNLFSNAIKANSTQSFSKQPYMSIQEDIPAEAREAFLSIFGFNELSPAIYKISPTSITMTAAHRLVGNVKSLIGLDISPLLTEEFNSVSEVTDDNKWVLEPNKNATSKLLKMHIAKMSPEAGFSEAVKKGFWHFKQFIGATGPEGGNGKSLDKGIDDHLKEIFKAVRENESILDEWRSPMFINQYVVDEYTERNVERKSMGMKTAETPDMMAQSDSAVSTKSQKTILNAVRPLANEDVTELTAPLLKLLRVDLPPRLTGNANNTGKNAVNIGRRSLSLSQDLGRLFNSRTSVLEDMLLSKGLTREYLMVHNLGGLQSQAESAVENAVMVLNGPLGREKWTVIGESLRDIVEEMPESISQHVWGYLSAMRELELEKNNQRKKAEYDNAIMAHSVTGQGPAPKEPKYVNVDPTTLSAAVIMKTVVEAKYGKDGGVAGRYAKRIADFANNAIAKKYYHYGMISETELDNLLRDGQWWIPMAFMKELHEDLDENEPFYNDGTKSALNTLNNDRTGAEHPFEELVRRAVSAHTVSTKAFIRSSLLRSIIQDGSDAEAAGIKRLTVELPKPVDEDVWKQSHPSMRLPVTIDRSTGKRIFKIKDVQDLDRRGYKNWIKDNVDKRDRVYAIWENGKASYYEVDDAQLRKAIDSIKIHQLPKVVKWIGKITSIFARMITLAPKFIVGMPIKDLSGASSRSKSGINILTAPTDLLRGLFEAAPIMFPSLARKFPSKFWNYNERILSMANQTSFQSTFTPHGVNLDQRVSKSSSMAKVMLDDMLSPFRESNNVKVVKDTTLAKLGQAKIFKPARLGWKGFVTNLERAASTADAALRMMERKLARQGSMGDISRMKASWTRLKNDGQWAATVKEVDQPGYMSDLYVDALDRQLTLDFSRKGEAVGYIAAMKMFAGPMFQDTATTMQRLSNPVTRKTFILKSLAAFTLPALANYARWHDDEDYQRLSYWDKLNFFQLGKNKDGTFNQIPCGIGLASVLFKDTFITMAQLITEADPMAGKEWLNQLVEQTPLQYVPLAQSSKDWLAHIAPTILEPTAEVGMNFNPLSNAPIDYDQGKQNAPMPEDRGVEKYGIVEKMLASVMNTSPRMTGYWMRNMLPGMGGVGYGVANEALTAGYHAVGGEENVGKQYDPVGTYLWKYWSGNVYGPTSLPVNRLYDLYESSANAYASVEQAMNNNAEDRAESIMKKHPEYQYRDMLKDYYGQIQRLKIERGMYLKTVDINDPMVKLELIENYDKPMTLLAEEATKAYYQIQKDTYAK